MGFPFLLPDLAALRALIESDASVWKKCPGSVDRDMVGCYYLDLIIILDLYLSANRPRRSSFYQARAANLYYILKPA